jgi:hypothetical protein
VFNSFYLSFVTASNTTGMAHLNIKSSVIFAYCSAVFYVCYIVVYGWCSYNSSASSHTSQRIHPVCCIINCSSASFFTANQAVTYSVTLRALCQPMFKTRNTAHLIQAHLVILHPKSPIRCLPVIKNSTQQSPPEVMLVAQLAKKFILLKQKIHWHVHSSLSHNGLLNQVTLGKTLISWVTMWL